MANTPGYFGNGTRLAKPGVVDISYDEVARRSYMVKVLNLGDSTKNTLKDMN